MAHLRSVSCGYSSGMATDREYCADVAAAEGEALGGTADAVDAWILLEYLPAWGAKATTDNALDAATRAWLSGLASTASERGVKMRLQFIRQPETDRTGVTLMLAVDGRLHRVDAPDYEALTRQPYDTVQNAPTEAAAHYFVCTNGQRDVCCARFGLPTYAALRERVGARVWQTTHVGGHRFAPNVLALPQAALYGRVQPHDVDAFVTAIDSGRLAAPWLRGRTRYAPEIQAAEVALAQRGLDTSGVASTSQTDGGIEVRFGAHAVVVRRGEPRAVLASCGEERKPVAPWIVSEPRVR
jgi:hypothetical protein